MTTTIPASAADYDKTMRDMAAQLNVPVPRISGVPVSGLADQPIVVFRDSSKDHGFDYAPTFTSPVTHGLEGLIAETLYSTLGSYLLGRPNPNGEPFKGTFELWAEPWTSDSGVTRPASRIAIDEQNRVARAGQPYRGMNPLVFDTPSTLAATIEAMRGHSDPLGRVAARILTFAKSLRYTPQVAVATTLASMRWYVPDTMPTNRLSTWLAAFQIPQVSSMDDTVAVWDRLMSTNRLSEDSMAFADMFYKATGHLMSAASASNARSAIRANSQCEAANSALAAIEVCDPNVRDRSLASGEMITGDMHDLAVDHVDVVMTSPTLRFKKGDRLTLRADDPGARHLPATVQRVYVGHDNRIHLYMVPQAKTRRSGGRVIGRESVWSRPEMRELDSAESRGASLVLTKTVMNPFASRIEKGRWIASTARDRVKRTMPLEVAVAAGTKS